MIRFGRLEITPGFLLLAAWLNWWDTQCLLPLTFVACLCHEIGHYAAIRWMGGDISKVRLTAVGAEMALSRPLSYSQEGFAALAGPGVSLMLALFFSCFSGGALFSGINLVLGCFNLLPVGTLDGGRALYCTVALTGSDRAAAAVTGITSLILTSLLLLQGAVLMSTAGNPTLLLAALWLSAHLPALKKCGFGACQQEWKQLE